VVAALSGCGNAFGLGDNAKVGGSITVAQSAAPDSLDPALAYSPEAAQAHWLVYPGLVTYKHASGADGSKLIPAAAEKLPDVSADGKTYTFQLRKGLRYSDGTPVRASDFEHAIQRAITLGWPGRRDFELIEGVRAYERGKEKGTDISGITTDDKSGRITVQLTGPNSELPYVLAFPAAGLVPRSTPFRDMSRRPPLGLGAYRFDDASIRTGRSYALVRNKGYKLAGIPSGDVDRITVKVVPSQAAQTQAVIDGRIDYSSAVPPADVLPEVRAKYKDRYAETPANVSLFMFLNTRERPFDDLKVRQAVNYGFDKRAAQRLASGLLQPSCNFLPPGLQGYQRPDPCPWGDPTEAPKIEKARQLVKDAGQTGTRVTVWGIAAEPSRRISGYYAEVLDKIGLKASTRFGAPPARAQTGFAELPQDFPHPSDFFDRLDRRLFADEKLDRLAARVRVTDPMKDPGPAQQLDHYVSGPANAYVLAYGAATQPSFLSERMDFENCDVISPVYHDDWSRFCLK
jgi:peptide/nickel transport system substrate-binding protein